MNQQLGRVAVTIASVGALCAATAPPAAAAPAAGNDRPTMSGFARLSEVNDAGVNGVVRMQVRGNRVDVSVYAVGLLRRAPHAMHIHTGGAGRCPTIAEDTNHDGVLSTTEGHHAYGMVATSLTLSGDTTPASALAVDRFATTPYGHLAYHRQVTVDTDTARKIRAGNAVVVVHGIDPDHSGTYDGAARSDLDPNLPLEATSPAACGAVHTYRG